MKKSKKFIKLCEQYGVNPDNVPEILSFQDACKDQGLDPALLPIVDHLPSRHQKRLIRDYELSVIADALRSGHDADYTDGSYKYFPVFKVQADKKRPSGFGLSYVVYVHWSSSSAVGVRHCFPNHDIEMFYAKHFIKLHIDHQLLT